MTCQSTETSAFSVRIQQRLGDSGYFGGCGGGGGGGGATAADFFKWAGGAGGDKSLAGVESKVEVPQIQFIDSLCPVS